MAKRHADSEWDRRGFLKCMAWVGTGAAWTMTNGTEKKFASPVLDTDERFSHTFDAAGTYNYYCSIHPKMTGRVVVA